MDWNRGRGRQLALAIGAQGNIRTETLKVFQEAEYRKLTAALP